eukprot:15357000-Ditylum_brightwellii.AAC.1
MSLDVSTILWTSVTTVPLTVQNQAIFHVKVATILFDDTINSFSLVVFAPNKQQNETYTYKDMLKQPDCKNVIAAMMNEITVHKDRHHWTFMKQSDVPNVQPEIHDLPMPLIDFVLAFLQAKLDMAVFMKLSIGMDVQQDHTKDYILHLIKSIYGLKQSSLN